MVAWLKDQPFADDPEGTRSNHQKSKSNPDADEEDQEDVNVDAAAEKQIKTEAAAAVDMVEDDLEAEDHNVMDQDRLGQ